MPGEDLIEFIARDIAQKILQLWRGKPEPIRPKLGDEIHIVELQNRVTAAILFTVGMKVTLMSAGETMGRSLASYMTLCVDVAEKVRQFREIKTLEEAKNSDLIDMLKTMFEMTKMGLLRLKDFDKRRLVFELEECVECAGLPNIEEAICYYTAGYLAGLFSVFLERNIRAYETKCCAKGDELCEFVLEIF